MARDNGAARDWKSAASSAIGLFCDLGLRQKHDWEAGSYGDIGLEGGDSEIDRRWYQTIKSASITKCD